MNDNNNGICSGISSKCPFIHCFQIKLEFRNVDFCGGRKTGEPGEKLSEQGWEPAQPTCDIRSVGIKLGSQQWEVSAQSPLHHPCSPTTPEFAIFAYSGIQISQTLVLSNLVITWTKSRFPLPSWTLQFYPWFLQLSIFQINFHFSWRFEKFRFYYNE